MHAPIARSLYEQPSAQLPQIKLPVFSGDPVRSCKLPIFNAKTERSFITNTN